MGSVSMMRSLDRFVDAHGSDLIDEALARLPASIRAREPELELANEGRRIEVHARWRLDDASTEHLELPPIDAYDAAALDDDLYDGDCRMGW